MDEASGGVDQEEDVPGGFEGHLTHGRVPVVGHRAGRRELVAREGVEGCDESGGVWCLLCRSGRHGRGAYRARYVSSAKDGEGEGLEMLMSDRVLQCGRGCGDSQRIPFRFLRTTSMPLLILLIAL